MTAARLLSLPTLAVVSLWALPAAAQDAPGDDSVNMVIVYGEDECPQSTEAEITVCARRPEGDRFRIPSSLRTSDSPENTSWTQRVQKLETVGNFGAMSCSPKGAGGFTGCTQALVDAAFAAKKESSDIRFGELIEKARQERLSTIDADAALEQARVEEIEQQQLDKAEKGRDDTAPHAEAEPGADNPPQH
ncbi:hypothetical protein IDJ81_02425 [Tsuneonella flava]|uniref:Uncharacterized protein n=1 Tax=Tsuneonella flava TaxID=2055955 RepID=A0ABX7KEH3_9SPHN|nr:hypothetical protein [Tsuneonella flava]QSB45040.1 hypothetical protein IDJ81_02425 [Tsuneonella flava]